MRVGALLLLAGLWYATSGVDARTPVDDLAAPSVEAVEAPTPEVLEGATPSGESAPPSATAASSVQDESHAEEEEGHGVDPSYFFLVVIAILIFAKLFGEAAERIGQPAVLGELVAGVVLGSSVLGIVPSAGELADVIHLLAEVGVAILLFEIGLETDLKEMFRVGKESASVAIVGVALPFALGFGYWYLFDPALGGAPDGTSLSMIAIFVGATLTATSVGITARVLTDLRKMHRPESRVIIGAAVIDDVLGLVILAIVSGLAAGAAVTFIGITQTFVVAVGFLVVAVIVGNFVAPRLFGLIDQMNVRGVLLVSAFSFALLFAALADLAGSAMIIGSFAAGIVLSTTNQFDLIVERVEPVADIFTPIFFVSVGAAVNINLFNPLSDTFNADVIIVGSALILVAVIGKLASGFVVGFGKRKMNRLAIGIGMVPRGEVGLIFADIGRRAGLLTQETFSAILIMVIVTTFIAPPLLKVVFRGDDDDHDSGQYKKDTHGMVHGGGHA
jgi:Kef-type K+ transport system membrane component KefB